MRSQLSTKAEGTTPPSQESMGKQTSIFKLFEAESPVGTEFRRLLNNITNELGNSEHFSILVTSPSLGEGKSTVCAFLAITAAIFRHKQTLIVDCDLRRPTIHSLFNLTLDSGLTDALVSRETSLANLAKPTDHTNLRVITAGRLEERPTKLLERGLVGTALEEAKKLADIVIVDSPPILPVTDPMLLSKSVDGVLLVVKAGASRQDTVGKALEIAQKGRMRILGMVLNNVLDVLPKYYAYEYYRRPR